MYSLFNVLAPDLVWRQAQARGGSHRRREQSNVSLDSTYRYGVPGFPIHDIIRETKTEDLTPRCTILRSSFNNRDTMTLSLLSVLVTSASSQDK